MNSVYLYSLLSLTEFMNSQSVEVRDYQGWLLVILCLVVVLVNFCVFLFEKGSKLK